MKGNERMKKVLAVLLAMMLIMTGFTACGSNEENDQEAPDTNLEQDAENADADADADAEDVDADTDAEDADKDAEDDADKNEDADADKEETAKKDDKKEETTSNNTQTSTSSKPSSSKPSSSKPSSSTTNKNDSNKTDKTDKNNKKDDKKEESKPSSGSASVSGTPAEIIDKIYAKFPVEELPLTTIEVDINDEFAFNRYTGLSSPDKVSAVAASESMMGAQAYSLVVVKVKDAKDAKDVAKEMKNGIDPRKWVCVEADDLKVAAAGDVVVLMMVSSEHSDVATAKDIINAFKKVAGSLDVSL